MSILRLESFPWTHIGTYLKYMQIFCSLKHMIPSRNLASLLSFEQTPNIYPWDSKLSRVSLNTILKSYVYIFLPPPQIPTFLPYLAFS